jgi:hypothetical protein
VQETVPFLLATAPAVLAAVQPHLDHEGVAESAVGFFEGLARYPADRATALTGMPVVAEVLSAGTIGASVGVRASAYLLFLVERPEDREAVRTYLPIMPPGLAAIAAQCVLLLAHCV